MRNLILGIFLLFSLIGAGCDSITDPLFSIRIELYGPRESIVAPFEGGWDWIRGTHLPPGYRCAPVLHVQASGSKNTSFSRPPIVWAGAEIVIYTTETEGPYQVIGLTSDELDRIFGYVYAGDNVRAQPLSIVTDTIPFRWDMRVLYYDPETGHNNTARFSSRCVRSS